MAFAFGRDTDDYLLEAFDTSTNSDNYATAVTWTAPSTAYGPFYLENRINEYNFYAEDNWKVTPALTLNLGLRYEYAGAARDTEDRVDYVYGNDGNNVEPRLGYAWVPRWEDGFLGAIAGQPGGFVIRGGYGLFDGRIFQSVFSQTGASIRTNPPNAISLGFTNLPNITNLSDPSLGYVFTPGPQTARHAETLDFDDFMGFSFSE